MKKKKQIEEIANILIASNNPFIDVPIEIIHQIAETLYNEGYRKQSDTVKEFVCKVSQIGSKRPLCLFNEYKEEYIDCLDQIKELAAQYGVDVEECKKES